MGIEITGNSGRPTHEAADAAQSQSTAQASNSARSSQAPRTPTASGDRVNVSNQAAQMHALEAEIANLPVVDTQRVQDVQRTLATGSFQIEPAQVANKLLTFESGLAES